LGVHIGRSSKENQAPDKESHPIHQTQELPGPALRHSCGYALADKGIDLRTIQEWLGHGAAERWRSIKVTEFEHRQITAVRKELDQEYETQVGLKTQPSKDAAQVKISSSSRT
jgi:hypothetical protein